MTVVRLHLALDRDASATFVELREKFTTFSIWTIIETTTALICANLPPMTTMLRRIFSKVKSSVGFTVASGSGSGSGFASGGGKKGGNSFFRSLRHKSIGSGRRFPSKTGPFGFSWTDGAQSPNDTTKSRSGKDQSMSVSSIPSSVATGNRQGSNRALQSIGVKTETIIDIEKAEYATVLVNEESNDGEIGNDGAISKNGHRVLRGGAMTEDYLPPSAETRGKVKTIVTGTELS